MSDVNPTFLYAKAYRLLGEGDRERAAEALAGALGAEVPNEIIRGSLDRFFEPDTELGRLAARLIGQDTVRNTARPKSGGNKTTRRTICPE